MIIWTLFVCRWRYPNQMFDSLCLHLLEGTAPAPKDSLLPNTREKVKTPRGRILLQESHRKQTHATQLPQLLFVSEPVDTRLPASPAISSVKCPALTQSRFQWVLTLEAVCALLSDSIRWARINSSLLVWLASSYLPTLFHVMLKWISTHPFASPLATWLSLCFSAGLHSRAFRSWLQTAGISSKALLWTWLHCLMHHPASYPASACLLWRARKPWKNTAIRQSLQKTTAKELLEQEHVRALCNSQSRVWSRNAL